MTKILEEFCACALFFLFFTGVLLVAARVSPNSTQAHIYADGVLLPRFTADFNDYVSQHPITTNHASTLNVKDLERWRKVVEDWKELESKMKEAGY